MTGKETEEMLLVLDLSVGKAQIVLIKPPLDAPSSSETTDVYIFGPETSVPGPGGAVGRGQKGADRPRQATAGHTLRHRRTHPSSPETTNVYIPGPETSIAGPGRAVRPVTPPETDGRQSGHSRCDEANVNVLFDVQYKDAKDNTVRMIDTKCHNV
ncbi:hypothetical protein Bbelb_003370 [Branchiostoma belcheri]|nr:hypothetical protein Bbelb_003370 [Branchiostoma belcheri]